MKNKKSLIAIIAVLLVAVIGVTFAYFQSTGTFTNVFQTGTYRLVTTEVFESPDNWKPGEEIPKTIVTKNEGTVPAAVRVSYTEQWLDSEENDITSSIEEGSVIINFDNTNDWIEEDGYYYYKYILEPNQTTSSFIKSVTLSEDIDEVSCTTEGTRQICESTSPALHAKYILTITKETIQADKYSEWNSSVELTERSSTVMYLSRQVEGQISIGDEIGIGDTEDFYVISTNSEKTLLLAKYNLLVGNYEYGNDTLELDPSTTSGYGLQNEDAIGYQGSTWEYWKGMVAFSSDEYWDSGTPQNPNLISPYNANGASYDGNPYPYVYDENSNVYQYISGSDGYINRLISMGAPSNITGRLLTYEEAEFLRVNYVSLLGDGSYWLGSVLNRYGFKVWAKEHEYDAEFYSDYCSHDSYHGVRPVIEIPTSELR